MGIGTHTLFSGNRQQKKREQPFLNANVIYFHLSVSMCVYSSKKRSEKKIKRDKLFFFLFFDYQTYYFDLENKNSIIYIKYELLFLNETLKILY